MNSVTNIINMLYIFYLEDALKAMCQSVGNVINYEYNLKDHLGNTRVVFADDNGDGSINTNEISQASDYCPFGLKHIESSYPNDASQKYLYNNKELQIETEWYDYGARHYGGSESRWHVIDALAEKYYSISPYAYALNNPIRFIDPDGNVVVDATGNPITYSKQDGWSANATNDTKRIGNAMMATRTGRKQYNKMVKASHPIQLTMSSEDKGGIMGTTFNKLSGKMNSSKTKITELKVESSKIVIYEGSLNTLLNGNVKGADENTQTKLNAVRESCKTMDQAIGATGTHESVHATSSQNMLESAENDQLGANNDVEAEPNKIQMQAVHETYLNNLQPLEPKMLGNNTIEELQ